MVAINNCEIIDICNKYPTGCPTNKWACLVYQKIRKFIKSVHPDTELDDEEEAWVCFECGNAFDEIDLVSEEGFFYCKKCYKTYKKGK